jgi:hypothetical protein
VVFRITAFFTCGNTKSYSRLTANLLVLRRKKSAIVQINNITHTQKSKVSGGRETPVSCLFLFFDKLHPLHKHRFSSLPQRFCITLFLDVLHPLHKHRFSSLPQRGGATGEALLISCEEVKRVGVYLIGGVLNILFSHYLQHI